MPRPITGRPYFHPGRKEWVARVVLPGDKDPTWIWLGKEIAEHDKPRAQIVALRAAKLAIEGRAIPEDVGVSVSEWWADYLKWCRERGLRSVDDKAARFKNWIEPEIGAVPIAHLSTEHLRKLVKSLDEQIRIRAKFYALPEDQRPKGQKPGLSWKSATNIWGEVTAALGEAATSKDDGLRIVALGEKNPADNVRGPDRGEEREQTALIASELRAVLNCEDVPLYRRVLYAVAAYTGLRAGELRGLTAKDLDFKHGVLHVRRQKQKNVSATTKSRAGLREVEIHKHVRPLLESLAKQRSSGPLLHVPPEEDCAAKLRIDLRTAKCDRLEIFLDDEHHQPFNFHGLRHTCITHWSVAGMPELQLSANSGHTDLATTRRYIAVGVVLRSTFGEPHAPLPMSLLDAVEAYGIGTGNQIRFNRIRFRGPASETRGTSGETVATPTGIEPVLPA